MITLVLVHAFDGVRILSEHIRLVLMHECVIRDSVHLLIHVTGSSDTPSQLCDVMQRGNVHGHSHFLVHLEAFAACVGTASAAT